MQTKSYTWVSHYYFDTFWQTISPLPLSRSGIHVHKKHYEMNSSKQLHMTKHAKFQHMILGRQTECGVSGVIMN